MSTCNFSEIKGWKVLQWIQTKTVQLIIVKIEAFHVFLCPMFDAVLSNIVLFLSQTPPVKKKGGGVGGHSIQRPGQNITW